MKKKPKNYWTYDRVEEEASKHSYKTDFINSSYQAYDKARVNGWLDEICKHMIPKRKPKDYWTYEKCLEEALKYHLKIDFQKNSQVAYKKALKNKWIDLVCSHMNNSNKPIGFWTLDKCKEEALKYKKFKDFRKNSPYVYKVCLINKWIEIVTSDMERKIKWTYESCKLESLKYDSLKVFRKNNFNCYYYILKKGWDKDLCNHMERMVKRREDTTKEACKKEALKYDLRGDFRKNSQSVYIMICKNGWLEELCGHQKIMKKTNGYWTKEKCKEEALKYENLKLFRENSPSALIKSRQEGWLDEICSHMDILGSQHKRFIYAYEFPDNRVYVGLTYNIKIRDLSHNIKGSVFNYREETGLIPILKKLTENPLEIVDAKREEGEFLKSYISQGWVALNKAKTGALGNNGIIKWTFENLQKEALKFKTKKEFRKNSESAYSAAKRLKIIDTICSHMIFKIKKPANYWNYENCKQESLKYESRSSYSKNSRSSYGVSLKNKWLDEFFPKLHR